MPLHYPGLSKALRQMESADLPRLYEQLDALFGRDNLPDDPTIEDVRAEAIRQTQIEFTDEMSPEYELLQFFLLQHNIETHWPHRDGSEPDDSRCLGRT